MTTLLAMFNPADESTPGHYGPSQTALLLLDFHSIFVEKLTGSKGLDALRVAAQMRTWAKSQGIQVVHCLIDVNATPYPTCKDVDRLKDTLVAMKSSGADEPHELTEDRDDDVTFKRIPGYVSALKSPGLKDFLQQKGIRSLVLAGLSTSGCVLRTAITATDEEYVVSIISDGCADRDDGIHDVMIEKVFSNRGYVASAAEFQQWFRRVIDGR